MNYIVWSKEEFVDTWTRTDCESESQAKAKVGELERKGQEVVVTIPITHTVEVKLGKATVEVVEDKKKPQIPTYEEIKQEAKLEATQDRPAKDKDTKPKS